jgi:hypothetical protein
MARYGSSYYARNLRRETRLRMLSYVSLAALVMATVLVVLLALRE